MEKNQEYTSIITKIGSNGEGITKNGDYTVFIPFALPSEKVRYKILKVKGKVAFGKLLEVLTPAEDRIRPACPVFGKCGGCQLQHIKYNDQLKLKSKIVADCLSKIAFIDFSVPLTEKSDLEWGYRNKLQLPVRRTKEGYEIGFFAPDSHRIIPIKDCPVQPKWCKDVISATREYIDCCGVSVYDDESGEGLLKHIVVRDIDGSLIITFVIDGEVLPEMERLIEILKGKFNDFSLYLNINKLKNNVIFGEKFICLFGKSKYTKSEFGIRYEIGPQSFLQVNDGMRRKIYREAVKAAGADENTVVIDAYSGAGLMTALFAQKCKKAVGIEIVKEAVESADELKKKNGIENMENICAACEDVLPSIMEKLKEEGAKVVLVLDPPRQGADYKVLETIKKCLPDKIVYISCSPQTLARDLGFITDTLVYKEGVAVKNNEGQKSPYKLISVKPFDQFAQTKHIETVCKLVRVSAE